MYTRRTIFYCLIFALSMFTFGSKSAIAATTFSLNHDMGAETSVAVALERFGKFVEDRSNGEMKVKLFHRGELGAEREMFNYMKIGSVEMGLSGSVVIAALAPEYGTLALPYLFKDQAHLRKVVSGPIGDNLKKRILESGIRVIGFMDRAPRHLTTKGAKIVRKPEDLKGQKIRVREMPSQIEAWRALGAGPVPMAPSEIYMALKTGVIDAYENPLDVMYSVSVFEVQDNLILTSHVREVQWLMASEKFWSNLDEKRRRIIVESAEEALKYGDKLTWEKESEYLKKLKDKGMKIIELTEKEKQAFMDRVKDVPKKFEGKWKPGLYEAILKEGKN